MTRSPTSLREADANTSMIFVPPRFAAEAILESVDAGIDLVVCITEGIPVQDMATSTATFEARYDADRPELPGGDLARRGQRRDHPGRGLPPGWVGLVSRSGTLTYQIVHELTQRGIGQSTFVGMGGDPIVGSGSSRCSRRSRPIAQTELVVMIGEIGGDDEEQAAAFIETEMSKPVVAYIAGFTAPPGKTMGHAGAIISGSAGTAQAKKEALEANGIRVGTTPTETAQLVAELAAA